MKVGILFYDNDFTSHIRNFTELYIKPTFVEREEGHYVTHLTSSMIVEMFKTYFVPMIEFMDKQDSRHWAYERVGNVAYYEGLKNYFSTLNERNIYWDDQIDDNFHAESWEDNNDASFTFTDGKEIFIR